MRNTLRLTLAVGSIALVTAVYTQLGATNATTAALSFLLVILVAAATSRLWIAITASLAAMLCFNFFFLPPLGTLTIADPQNWVALFTFLAVSLVASNLSSAVRARAQDAMDRRDELARLFDLSRDVLLMTDSRDAMPRWHVRSRAASISTTWRSACRAADDWDVFEAGSLRVDLRSPSVVAGVRRSAQRIGVRLAHADLWRGTRRQRRRKTACTSSRCAWAPGRRAAGGGGTPRRARHARPSPASWRSPSSASSSWTSARPRSSRARAKSSSRRCSPRSATICARRSPPSAWRPATFRRRGRSDEDRQEQSELILVEVERLNRLFQNILDMARIDAGGDVGRSCAGCIRRRSSTRRACRSSTRFASPPRERARAGRQPGPARSAADRRRARAPDRKRRAVLAA